MIIPFDENYKFCFIEKDSTNIKSPHPVDNYYIKLNDLSINLYINFKWIDWGYIFLNETSTNLDLIMEEFPLDRLLKKSIGKVNIEKEERKILSIDDIEIKNYIDFEKIKNKYIEENILDKNDKIHMKLKINLREFIVLTNLLTPTFLRILKE